MSQLLNRILDLMAHGEIRVSEHGYGELAEDEINVRDVVQAVRAGQLIEEYPDYAKGLFWCCRGIGKEKQFT